jgi:hypothetical protein
VPGGRSASRGYLPHILPGEAGIRKGPFPDCVPTDLTKTWLSASDDAAFQGIDAIYCREGPIFLLPMTTSPKHTRVSLPQIVDHVRAWMDDDVRGHRFFTKSKSILVADPWTPLNIPISIGLMVQKEIQHPEIRKRFKASIPYTLPGG